MIKLKMNNTKNGQKIDFLTSKTNFFLFLVNFRLFFSNELKKNMKYIINNDL